MIQKPSFKIVGFPLLFCVLLAPSFFVGTASAIPITIEPVFGELTVRQLLQQGQYARVRDIAQARLRDTPDNGDMRAVLGYAQAGLGNLDEARQNVLRAIELNSADNGDDLRVLLAEILVGMGETSEAERVLLEVVGRAPRNTRALIGTGLLYSRVGDALKAAEYFGRVLSIDPQSEGALNALLQIHMAQNDYAAVRRVARQIPAGSPSESIGNYFEAQTLIRQSSPDYGAAGELLENALAIAPATPETLTTLGYVLLKEGRTAAAVSRLSEAVDLAPDFFAAQKLLGTVLLALNQPQFAANHLQRALSIEESPELRHALARAYLAQGDSERGLKELMTALESTEQPSAKQSALEGLYSYTGGEFEQSEEALRQALEDTPEADHLHTLLVASLLKQQRFEGAAREARQALASFPEKRVLLLNLLALAELGSGAFDKAEAELLEALALDSDSTTTRNNLSTVYFRQGQYAKAQLELETILTANPNDLEARVRLARVFQASRQFIDAERALLDADGQVPRSGALLRELVLLKIRERDHTAALEYASAMVARYPRTFEGYLLQAQALASLGRETDAVYAIDTGFAEAGETQGALAAAASLARVNGWHELAVRYLLRHNAEFGLDDPNLRRLYAVELIEVGQTDNAREFIRDRLGETNPEALFLLAKSYIADGDQVRAEEYIDAALDAGVSAEVVENQRAELRVAMQTQNLKENLESEPDNALHYRSLAETHELVGDFDAAISVYEQGLGKAQSDSLFQTQIARLLLKKGETQRATEIASSVIRTEDLDEDTAFRAYAVLGMSWVTQREMAKAEQALTRATGDGSRLAPAFYELAKIKSTKGETAAAMNLLRSAIDIEPGSQRYYLALAALHQRSGSIEETVAVYEDGLARNPGAVSLLNNIALIYLNQGANDKALSRATEALELSPENPRILNTLGRVYLQDRAPEKAIRYFERAVDRMPASSLYRYHLGVAYYETGSMELAKVELEEALARQTDAPWAPDIRKMLQAIEDA